MHSGSTSGLTRAAGYSFIIGAILALVFMLHHPGISADNTAGALAELRAESAISAWVHGLLMLVLLAVWLGGYGLTRLLGWNRVLPVAGLLLFTLGTLGYCIAAITSGFITPRIGELYAGAPAGQMEYARMLVSNNWLINQAYANAGLIGSSVGVTLWSLALCLGNSGWQKAAGVIGLFAGLVPVVLLFSGHLSLHITGMTAVVVIQGVWYVVCGGVMLRGRLPEPD